MKALMEKVKGFCKVTRKKLLLASAGAITTVMAVVPAFAVEPPTFDLSTTMTAAVQSVVTNLLSMIGAVLPITVTLMSAAIGVSYGISFIKRIVGKSGAGG